MSGKSPPSLTRGWAGPELQVMLDPECVRYQASVNGRRWLKQGREKGVVNSSAGKGGACAEGRLKPPCGRWPSGGWQLKGNIMWG